MAAVTINFAAYRILTIQGTVTLGGNGLDGVTLTVYGLRSTGGTEVLGTAETAQGGAYSLEVTILDGVEQLRVQPSLAGYSFSPAWQTVGVARDATCNFVALRTYSITGNIKRDGVGVPGVQLFSGKRTFSAGPRGGFTWGGFPPGTHTITPRAAGLTFTPTARNVTITDSDVAGCNFTAEGQPTRALRVTIQDAAGRGVANVQVRVWVVESGTYYSLSAPTGTDGVCLFLLPEDAVPLKVEIEAAGLYWVYPNPLVITDEGEGFYPRWTCTATVEQAHLVSGYVIGPEGSVRPGITFRVTTAEGQFNDVTSDANGYYIVAVPLDTTLTLTLVTPGYVLVNNPFPTGPVTADTPGCTLTVIGVGELYGLVTDANGVGLEGASVYGESVQTFSGPGGWYSLQGVPGGWGSYSCYLPGYEFQVARLNVVGRTRYDFVATGAPSGHSISGTIEDGNSNPVPDVWVRIVGTGLAAQTNTLGQYIIRGLANGEYVLSPDKPGWVFDPPAPTVLIADNDEVQNFAASLETPVYKLTGTVSIEGGGTLGGALVTETVTGKQALTASDGTYTISGLPNGSYRLNIIKPGWAFDPATPTVVIEDGDQVQNFTATRLVNVLTISGQVLYNNLGLEGVRFYASGFVYYSDADGNFELSGLSPGSYEVTPQLAGYIFDPDSIGVELSDSDVTGLQFTATRSYTLSGCVTLRGAGLAGVSINISGRLVTTDNAGNWACGGLESGIPYTITPLKAGYLFTPVYRTVTIQDADVGGLNFAATEEADTTAPVVSIVEPAPHAEITGPVRVEWTATDNRGVVTTRVYLDGNLQATLPGGTGAEYSWDWNPSGWANGRHTLRVEASDAAGNVGYDEISVTVNRSLAAGTKYFFTKPLPAEAENPENWRLSPTVKAALGMFVRGETTIPADPAERYNALVGVAPPDTAVSSPDAAWPSFHLVTPEQSFAWPDDCVSGFILGLRAQPQVVWSWWEDSGHDRITRIVPLPSGDLALLAEPAALLRLTLSAPVPALSVWESVLAPPGPGSGEVISFSALWRETISAGGGSETPAVADACYYDGKILLAAGSHLLAKDLDTGDLTIALTLAGLASVDAVAAGDSGAFVATWDGATAGLYFFSWASTRKICDLPARAQCLLASGNACTVGGRNGRIYRVSGAVTSLLFDTGEAVVNRLVQDGTVTWALTGTSGKLFRSAPTWQLDNAFALSQLHGAAVYGDDLYLGGNGNGLWRLAADAWNEWQQLDGVAAIYDLYATDTALLLAVGHAAGARLYRLEIAEPGGFTCGAKPPEFVHAVLRYV